MAGTISDYRGRLAALCLAMLLPSLGISIANVALPTLQAAFVASSQSAQWVVIGYLVALSASLVAAGRMGDLFGHRRMLLIGMAVFALAASVAAVAPHLWVVVLARAVQGLGAAILMALTVAAVGDIVPRERMGSAMGLLGTVSAVGTALGPSLGGVLIAALGWPAVFAAMAVAGALSFAVAYALLPADRPAPRREASFDVPGAALLAGSVAAFALAATLSPLGLLNALLLALAAIGAIAFVLVELRAAAPLVQLKLMGNKVTAAGLVSIGLVSAIMMTTLVVGPFYLSGVLGLDPAMTGLVMSVGPIVSALVGVPAGRIVDRLGSPAAISAGLGSLLTGALSMALLAPELGVGGYIGSLVPLTAGYALFQAANNTAVMATAGPEQRGVVSALLALARNLGLVAGASAMGALFAVASAGLPVAQLPPGGATGLRVTFFAAAVVAGGAMLAWQRARR